MCGKSIICCAASTFLLVDMQLLMEKKIVEMKSMIKLINLSIVLCGRDRILNCLKERAARKR